MLHLLFPVDYNLIDVFISQSEEFCNRNDQLLHGLPYPFRNGQFQGILGYFFEKLSHGFVCGKPFHKGENVVLQSRQGCRCNLRGKIVCLAFAQSQQPFGFLENDFQGPSLGINPVGFEEFELDVRSHQSVPCAPFASPDKEQAHLCVCKGHLCHDVMAAQPSAVPPFALFVKVLNQGRRSIGLSVQKVFCPDAFSYLDHTQVIALDAAGADEADDILAREPTVCQHIPEPDALADGAPDHFEHQVDFIPRVFINALLDGITVGTLFGETPCEFLIGHPELSLLSFFTQQCKIENHLGRPVRDGKKQGLETENAPVLDIGKHPADVFNAPSRLGIVRVIDYQADRATLAFGADPDSRPKLKSEIINEFPPGYLGVAHKTVEHVFFACQQAA